MPVVLSAVRARITPRMARPSASSSGEPLRPLAGGGTKHSSPGNNSTTTPLNAVGHPPAAHPAEVIAVPADGSAARPSGAMIRGNPSVKADSSIANTASAPPTTCAAVSTYTRPPECSNAQPVPREPSGAVIRHTASSVSSNAATACRGPKKKANGASAAPHRAKNVITATAAVIHRQRPLADDRRPDRPRPFAATVRNAAVPARNGSIHEPTRFERAGGADQKSFIFQNSDAK